MRIQKATGLIAFFLFFSCISSFSQDFLPGTITLQTGRQEIGFISVNRWGTTAQQIEFKDGTGKLGTHDRRTLQSFEITRKDKKKERYVCKTLQINRSSVELTALEIGPAPNMIPDTLILQVLLQADFTLLFCTEGQTRHLFLEKDSIQELIYKRFLPDGQRSNRISENNHFRQQLLVFTKDCPEFQSRILKMSYNEHNIQKLLTDYCACRKVQIAYAHEQERVKPFFYVVGGGANVRSHISTTIPNGVYERTNLKPYFTPVIGLGLAWPIPFSRGGLWLVNDLSTWKVETSGEIIAPDEYIFKDYAIDLRASGVRWQSMIRWYFIRKIGLFGECGFKYDVVLDSKCVQTSTTKYKYTPNVSSSKEIGVPSSNRGGCIGLGSRLKHFSIMVRYSSAKVMEPAFEFTNTGIPTSSFSLLVGYQF